MSEIAREEIDGVIGRLVDEGTRPAISSRNGIARPSIRNSTRSGLARSTVAGLPPESTEPEARAGPGREDFPEGLRRTGEAEFGEEIMRTSSDPPLMQVIDRWREHPTTWTTREGIHLRGFAQIDLLVGLQERGRSMFQELMNGIWMGSSRR